MKLVETYKEILKEEKSEYCIKNFGKELFGTQFSYESNNKLENKTVTDIRKFTYAEYGEKINKDFVKEIKILQKCISSFPHILETSGIAYRGEKLRVSKLIKHLSTLNNNQITLTYKSHSPIESWTSSYKVATLYSTRKNDVDNKKLSDIVSEYTNQTKEELIKIGFLDLLVPVVLSTEANSNSFLFKSQYFKKLSVYPLDDEFLRIDNKLINVNCNIFPSIGENVSKLIEIFKLFI